MSDNFDYNPKYDDNKKEKNICPHPIVRKICIFNVFPQPGHIYTPSLQTRQESSATSSGTHKTSLCDVTIVPPDIK